jgi:hypothetical protein
MGSCASASIDVTIKRFTVPSASASNRAATFSVLSIVDVSPP